MSHDQGYKLASLEGNTLLQEAHEIRHTHINLDEAVCKESVENLNQVLVDTIMLRDLYKKHHWQLSGITFYQLHLLFDEHYEQQKDLVDNIAERVQLLGGISIGMPKDVAEKTKITTPPIGREDPAVQITRLIEAHKTILGYCHDYAEQASSSGDHRTEDLLVSEVIMTNEKQVWFLAEHLVPMDLQGK